MKTVGLVLAVIAVPVIVAAQSLDPSLPSMTDLRWAVQFGGPLFAALMIVLWFYRRDFKDAAARGHQRDSALVAQLSATTAALAANSERMSQVERKMSDLERQLRDATDEVLDMMKERRR